MRKPFEPDFDVNLTHNTRTIMAGGFAPEGQTPNNRVVPIFETKDSGEREVFSSGMMRDSEPKTLEPGLIPVEMLVRWAELMGRGALKYEARNWEKASTPEELDRMQRSAFRHFLQWLRGDTDEDHAAAVFFNIAGAEHIRVALLKTSERVSSLDKP